MSKLDLSLGVKMQMAILERQPHCIDKPHVVKPQSFLSFSYDLSVLPKPRCETNLKHFLKTDCKK